MILPFGWRSAPACIAFLCFAPWFVALLRYRALSAPRTPPPPPPAMAPPTCSPCRYIGSQGFRNSALGIEGDFRFRTSPPPLLSGPIRVDWHREIQCCGARWSRCCTLPRSPVSFPPPLMYQSTVLVTITFVVSSAFSLISMFSTVRRRISVRRLRSSDLPLLLLRPAVVVSLEQPSVASMTPYCLGPLSRILWHPQIADHDLHPVEMCASN